MKNKSAKLFDFASIESKNNTGAIFSPCMNYRYQLWRIWDDSKDKVLFIMLNPSTADADNDDPTIRRCINYAKDWGYGGVYVGNLFGRRSTDPKGLLAPGDPIGPDNLKNLSDMKEKCSLVVTAWGNTKLVEKLLPDTDEYDPLYGVTPHYLELSKDGTPKHPLYLKGDLKPKPHIIKY